MGLSLGAVAIVAVLVIGAAFLALSQQQSVIMLGFIDVNAAMIATIVGGASVLGLLLLMAKWWSWLLAALAVLPMLGVMAVVFVANPSAVVSLRVGECETPYVVDDGFGGAAVYRQDGVWLDRVAWLGVDLGYRPFSRGEYRVESTEDSVSVWYSKGHEQRPGWATGEPNLVLPFGMLHEGLSASC